MASSFINFLVKLAEATEAKIVTSVKELNGYTLKHWAGRQPQEPHGWRYGANILRPNGMGAPSIERGKKYLGRITDRDLQDGLTGKRIAGGNANNRGIKNVHMEYQRRSRGGDSKLRRWDKGERDREYGRSLSDQQGLGTGRGGKTSAVGKNTPSNESKNQKWSLQGGPKMKPPKDGIGRSPSIRGDRVHGGKGTGNPWQKQKLLVGVHRAAARKLIRGVRKSPVALAKTEEGRKRQISAVGGRQGRKGDKWGLGSSDKRKSAAAYAAQRERDARLSGRRVKTPAQKLRDAAAKRKARAAATAAGAPLQKTPWGVSARRRRKELTLVNPILGKVMEATHERVASNLLIRHKELFVANQALSPYTELVAYKAKKQAALAKPDKGEYDEEGGMAKSQLKSVIRNAKSIHDGLQDDTNIAEWAQSKLSLAEDYISTVANYMLNEENGTAKKEGKGLWSNIHAKRERGEKPAKPGHKDYPDKLVFQKLSKTAKKERKNFYDIKINPDNIGKFTATKKRTGKTTEELTHSKNPLTKKRAVFAENAARWSK